MELLDGGIVAKGVRPPAGYIKHAIAFHVFEELPAAICGAGEFGLFFGFALCNRCFVLFGDFNVGDGAKVWSSLEDHGLVRIDRALITEALVF